MAHVVVSLLLIACVSSSTHSTQQTEEELLTPDMAPIKQHYQGLSFHSELLTIPSTETNGHVTIWEEVVKVEGAAWLKLEFENPVLGIGRADGPFLKITSLEDNAIQYLDAISIQEWYLTSAYFNGDSVKVEIVCTSNAVTKHARISVIGATVGDNEIPSVPEKTICDTMDKRIYSPELTKAARYIGRGGCSGWIYNDRHNCFGTAGHCGVNAQGSGTMQFNVPLSSTTGQIRMPPPSEQFSVDRTSVQMANGGVGNDWGYLGTFVNSNTGLTAFQHVRGFIYTLGTVSPPTSRDISIHIAGHGICETAFPQGACASREYSQVLKNHTDTGGYQLVGTSSLRYRADTTGGNSGSGVEMVENYNDPSRWRHVTIGIHTHGGCTRTGGSNLEQPCKTRAGPRLVTTLLASVPQVPWKPRCAK